MSQFSSIAFSDEFIEVSINGFEYKIKEDNREVSYDKIFLKAPTIQDQANLEIVANHIEKLYKNSSENNLIQAAILARSLSPDQTFREVIESLQETSSKQNNGGEGLSQNEAVRKETIELFNESRSFDGFLFFIREVLHPFIASKIYLNRDGFIQYSSIPNYIYSVYKTKYYLFLEELFIEYFSFFLEFLPSKTLEVAVNILCQPKVSSQPSEDINLQY